MQNKPNLVRRRRIANDVVIRDYENIANCKLYEYKPKTNPIKANTKPIKANKMPKQTQSKPILSAVALAKADSKGAPMPLRLTFNGWPEERVAELKAIVLSRKKTNKVNGVSRK
jgi:hypothetical protein